MFCLCGTSLASGISFASSIKNLTNGWRCQPVNVECHVTSRLNDEIDTTRGGVELRDFWFSVHKSSVCNFKIVWFRGWGVKILKTTRYFILQAQLSTTPSFSNLKNKFFIIIISTIPIALSPKSNYQALAKYFDHTLASTIIGLNARNPGVLEYKTKDVW